ncbi:MAG: Chloroperoxidase, partial [Lentinula lateritia]
HGYVGPVFPRDARAPCPGLNTLANHGYIPRSGRNIDFITLVAAIMEVYNISLPLALLLSVPGFLLYAHLRVCWNGIRPSVTYTLTLSSLSSFGPGLKIAHRASLVHPNYPTQCPDIDMVNDVVRSTRGLGLTLSDLAGLRVSRESESELRGAQKLSGVHEQVALGESALTWLIFAWKGEDIPVKYFKQWFGEERIPDGWTRPEKTIGLFDARKVAGSV